MTSDRDAAPAAAEGAGLSAGRLDEIERTAIAAARYAAEPYRVVKDGWGVRLEEVTGGILAEHGELPEDDPYFTLLTLLPPSVVIALVRAARPAPVAAPRDDVAVIRREAWETVLAELEQLAATVEGDPLALGRGAAETIRWAAECVRNGVTVKPWAELSDAAAREAARGEDGPLHDSGIDVADYGALGDGSTDDTDAFQAALDAAARNAPREGVRWDAARGEG